VAGLLCVLAASLVLLPGYHDAHLSFLMRIIFAAVLLLAAALHGVWGLRTLRRPATELDLQEPPTQA
jgi:succinate dehydrogenase/fumarate reductase cytochrome b subunit